MALKSPELLPSSVIKYSLQPIMKEKGIGLAYIGRFSNCRTNQAVPPPSLKPKEINFSTYLTFPHFIYKWEKKS